MATQEYIAAAEFNLNLNIGAQSQSVIVRKGDTVFFDGINAEHKGVKGSAPTLRSVVGNWIREKASKATPEKSQDVVKNGSGQFDITEDSVLAKAIDAEMKPPFNTRKVINSDESEVSRVRSHLVTGEASASKNVSGVSIDTKKQAKSQTIHEEQLVVKETVGKKAKNVNELKHATLSSESEGVVVKRVSSAPAKSKTEVTEKTVVEDNAVSKPTAYEKSASTDIGSSTQTRSSAPRDTGAVEVGSLKDLERELHLADTKIPAKRVVEHSDPTPKQSVKEVLSQQDGKVVAKTSYKKGPVETSIEGIETTLTVGSDEVAEIVATTSRVDNGMEAKVTFSKTGNEATDIQQEGVVVSRVRTAKIESIEEDTLDVEGILSEISTEEKVEVQQDPISSLTLEGVIWGSLHWKKRIQLILTLKDKSLLQNIIDGDHPKPLKAAAEKRLADLG